MTNDTDGNGHQRGGELPERMRRMLNRAMGSSAPQGPGTDADPAPDPEKLRSDLHAAVDRIVDTPAGAHSPDLLKRELHNAISRAVDQHAAPPAPAPPPLTLVPAPAETSPTRAHPVDSLVERLNVAVERALGNARPGMERSRAYLGEKLPPLVDRLSVVLAEIAADEQRMLQVERALIGMLKSRMSEKSAQRVAKLTVAAAKAAAWRKRRGTSGQG
jgi:hypothetical protein